MQSDYGTHLPVLAAGYKATTGNIAEFGCGYFSTPVLHELMKGTGRKLYSYDNDINWLNKFKSLECEFHRVSYIQNWNKLVLPDVDMLFMDHAPAEQRQHDIIKHLNTNLIIVHDAEKVKLYNYDYSLFKFRKMYNFYHKKTIMLSNHIDVTKLI